MGNVAHPDLLLARRAVKNDPRAWEEIVGLLGERIYNLALRFAGSPGEAEELTQDVFLRLYRGLGQYRGEVPLLAWSLRLSRNLCIDHWRHHQKRLASEAPGEELFEFLPGRSDTHRETEREEERRLIHRALAGMSETLSTVVVLYDLEGLTYDEIADFLEVPLGTVKSRLNRARHELVARLDSFFGVGAASGGGLAASGQESA
jgi:RNA polymerase sigma-70 factor (ECF subfamily)